MPHYLHMKVRQSTKQLVGNCQRLSPVLARKRPPSEIITHFKELSKCPKVPTKHKYGNRIQLPKSFPSLQTESFPCFFKDESLPPIIGLSSVVTSVWTDINLHASVCLALLHRKSILRRFFHFSTKFSCVSVIQINNIDLQSTLPPPLFLARDGFLTKLRFCVHATLPKLPTTTDRKLGVTSWLPGRKYRNWGGLDPAPGKYQSSSRRDFDGQ